MPIARLQLKKNKQFFYFYEIKCVSIDIDRRLQYGITFPNIKTWTSTSTNNFVSSKFQSTHIRNAIWYRFVILIPSQHISITYSSKATNVFTSMRQKKTYIFLFLPQCNVEVKSLQLAIKIVRKVWWWESSHLTVMKIISVESWQTYSHHHCTVKRLKSWVAETFFYVWFML
jgi:hypothetical protein